MRFFRIEESDPILIFTYVLSKSLAQISSTEEVFGFWMSG